jgi:hypothetical protein
MIFGGPSEKLSDQTSLMTNLLDAQIAAREIVKHYPQRWEVDTFHLYCGDSHTFEQAA